MSTYGPYSPMRRAGDLLYVSGQVGINPENKVAPNDAANQAERAILNIENVLLKAGANLDNVVKTTIFLVNIDDVTAVNEVYEQRFSEPRPARSTVGVHELPRVAGDTELLVEIEDVAYKERT